MSASIRTLIYAGVAVCCAGAAYITHESMQPPQPEGFDLVGQEFYPNFTEPASATKLRVAAYDDLKEESKVFAVEKHGDSWRIPSHHDYPAEAKKRLAETAASVKGVKREAVAGRQQAEHERYGVIDPLDEESKAIRGRGQRITLYNDGGKEIVDLIIGKQVEGQSDQYYVRLPTEKETYRSTLNVKLSTKFADWIEPDLLKLSSSDLVSFSSSKPIIEEKVVQTRFGAMRALQQTGEDKVELTRKDSAGDWILADVNEDTEEFDNGPVSSAVTAIDDLKIIGVRPKPQGITPELKLEIPETLQNNPARIQAFIEELRDDMDAKGFRIGQDEQKQLFVSTREGELVTATKNGVVYNLHFGNPFEGSLDDIEFGAADQDNAKDKNETKDESKTDGKTDSNDDGSEETEETDDGGKQKGRYVLVRVEFDPKYIGQEPVPPVEPEKPAAEKSEEDPKPQDKKPADNSDNKEPTADDSTAEEPATDDKPVDDKKDAGSDENDGKDKKSSEQAAYEEAMKDYDSKKIKYESDKDDYEKKVAEGKQQVQRLNDRFGEWYYVISESSIESLQLSRDKLVKMKDISEQPPVVAPVPAAKTPE